MRQYELYLVIDADVEEEDVNAIVERMTESISTQGGEVIKVEARGKRRLTFPIQKKQEGQDIILFFQTQPPALPEMERVLKLDERVLRYLIVRTDED